MKLDRDYLQMLHDDILYGICRRKDMHRFLGVFWIYRKKTKREQLRDVKEYIHHIETLGFGVTE